MRRILKSIVFSFIFFISIVSVQAQSKDIKKGDSYFKKGEYYQALLKYEEAQKSGEKLSVHTQKNLGYIYYVINNVEKAYGYYSEISDKLTGDDILIYAEVLHKFGFYSEDGGAIEWYKKALQAGANPIEVNDRIESCKWAEAHQTLLPYLVNPSGLLSPGVSFGIQYYKEGVVFSYKKEGSSNIDRLGNVIQNLYYGDLKDNDISNPRIFSKNLISPTHLGAVSFTSDFKTMYFTKSVRVKGGESKITILSVTWDGKDWKNEKQLSFIKNEYDYAYPAVSADDKFLYFVSNMKGGYGQKDIYRVERLRGGEFGTVKNLGPQVNTFGNEEFPTISKNNVLYFSSDGQKEGYGGLDIFKAEYVDGAWKNVQNMGLPFNSSQDDFGLVFNPNNPDVGFLSSTRRENQDNFFTIRFIGKKEEPKKDTVVVKTKEEPVVTKKPEEPVKIVEPEKPKEPVKPVVPIVVEPDRSHYPVVFNAKVKSTFNNEPAAGVEVKILDVATGKLIAKGVSDSSGKFNIKIPENYRKKGQQFELVFSKEGEYNSKRMIINIDELNDINVNGLSLTPIFNDEVLDDINGMILYYVGMELTDESKKTLDRLAVYLAKNPQLVVKLNGHTQATGNKLNNLMESQRMAENVEEMLIKKGIDDDNLIPRGYGERYIVNGCKRGVYCDRATQLKNRRIEVVVWRVKGK